jgi:O-6-methylguanine DNA methyltransferase
MTVKYVCTFDTAVSPLTMVASEVALERVDFGARVKGLGCERDSILVYEKTEVAERAYRQIVEYLEGKRRVFDIALALRGSDFQMKVWAAMREIPWGTTRTYKEIAAASGNEKASRAAGGAIHRNPVVIIIPCHRVIGSDGSLTGFGGGLDVKRRLLEIEGRAV